MPNCSICDESLKSPVSLPCGHVFCRDCIFRTIAGSSSNSHLQRLHSCPACKAPYSAPLSVDTALVPPYLRPHILPPIRRVYLDDSQASTSASTSTSTNSTPTPPALASAEAELHALRTECSTWRRRAETHAAANHTLLTFTRAAKEYALRLRAERDAERNQCVLLKRKLAELMPDLDLGADSPFAPPSSSSSFAPPRSAPQCASGLPVFLAMCKRAGFACVPDSVSVGGGAGGGEDAARGSLFGPPMKRRRCGRGPSPATGESEAGAEGGARRAWPRGGGTGGGGGGGRGDYGHGADDAASSSSSSSPSFALDSDSPSGLASGSGSDATSISEWDSESSSSASPGRSPRSPPSPPKPSPAPSLPGRASASARVAIPIGGRAQ